MAGRSSLPNAITSFTPAIHAMWKRHRHRWPRFLETLSALFLLTGLVAGIGLVGWQATTWFESGVWRAISVLAALKSLGIAWAHNPTAWIGFYNTLDFLPLSVTLAVMGVVMAYVLWFFADHLKKTPKGVL